VIFRIFGGCFENKPEPSDFKDDIIEAQWISHGEFHEYDITQAQQDEIREKVSFMD
jgi:hypothetical protein